jgi:hypothetical protein
VCDANQISPAVGAVLLKDGRPIAYYSRKLSGAELNYCPSGIERLAVIFALREWRCYLEGAREPCTLVTKGTGFEHGTPVVCQCEAHCRPKLLNA